MYSLVYKKHQKSRKKRLKTAENRRFQPVLSHFLPQKNQKIDFLRVLDI